MQFSTARPFTVMTVLISTLLVSIAVISARAESLGNSRETEVQTKIEKTVAPLPAGSKKSEPKKVRLLTATSTPLQQGHAATVFSQSPEHQSMRFQTGQAFSKWSAFFESALSISEVRVNACDGKDFEDGVEMYVDFDRARLYVDGGKPRLSFKWSGKARSITLGFLESKSLCIESVEILSEQKQEFPRILAATKVETHEEKRNRIEWKWSKEFVIDSLRIWNGDRMAGGNFVRKGRIKDFRVNGLETVIGLKDQRYAQTVRLPAPISGASGLTIDILATYQGVDSKDPVASEIQLLSGTDVWLLPAEAASFGLPAIAPGGSQVRNSKTSSFVWSEVLDRDLIAEGEDVWTFRFRSDGTFFARIFSDQYRSARSWSVLGRWELSEDEDGAPVEKFQSRNEKGSGSIRLIGSRTVGAGLWDSAPCGTTCFGDPFEKDSRGPASRADQMNELRIDERVELQKGPQNRYYLRSRSRIEKPGLEFKDLKLRNQSIFK